MSKFFNQETFIKKYITKREESFFAKDIANNTSQLSEQIKGKSLLVIGGAGTIGSSFIKAVIKFYPAKLTVVDYSENGLTELTRDLRSAYNEYMPAEYLSYPFDFGGNIFKKLIANNTYDVVACFAAHKHVRSEKDHLAIEAMFRNNVVNTFNLLNALKENPPRHIFSVSTDKAANPVNVMGATKKVMEKVLLSYADRLKISTARFANVAFSNGSLLFGFNERLAKRQPLSSPSDVKRYFVSPEESGQLCMLACMLGESSDIFFPKLYEDQMMTFSAIAEHYLRENGMKPDYCDTAEEARLKALEWKPGSDTYPVYFFKSDTSGEKKYEEFYDDNDELNLEQYNALGVIKNTALPSSKNIKDLLEQFEILFTQDDIDKAKIIALLHKYLPDFSHIETGKNLDQKM